MAKVKIQGNASGTGILTVTAPNTSTDRTLTLPDATGTLSVGSSIDDNGNATAITIDSTELVSFANAVVIPATINAGSSGSSEGTTGRINFGGVSGSINGFTITNENGNYLDIKPNSSSNGIKILNDGGMCFGTDTATANALDDYEEGTWTPEIRDLGGNSATLSIANGSYTKIGRWVQINFQITLSSKGSMTGNYILMGGIPFNHPTESYNGTGVIDSWGNFAFGYSGLWFDTSSTGSLMWLNAVAAAGGTTSVMPNVAALNDNSHVKGSCMYQISV